MFPQNQMNNLNMFGFNMNMNMPFGVMGGNGSMPGNQQMNMKYQMAMMNGMNPWMMYQMMLMNKPPLTEQQKIEARMRGYLEGKRMAKERLASMAAANPVPNPVEQEGPITGELKIKFNKNGTITYIKMNSDEMVADLINEYFIKTGTQSGTFKFNGNELSPTDFASLAEKGLRNNSEIIVN